jgi:alpha-galactosidase
MTGPILNRRGALVAGMAGTLAAATTAQAASRGRRAGALLAARPPMGWNSWNSFATTINEAQARETAAIMARELLAFGYDIFTVDIQWYEPNASSYEYSRKPVPHMDGYGRLLPAPNRFPSATGSTGFTRLAADVHALGMKFGIHLMRGIPRLAVERNLPVFGTNYRARDIADTGSTCPWNPDMYGVDMRKPGAQAYYDGAFALYASWGVDFVKMDDMSRPYDAHAPEIEAAHKAILASGRPMMLSLSPGETPVPRGDHVGAHAHMWRISDDFWDEWRMLKDQFVRLENWHRFAAPDAWPDADMLPLGRLALGKRDTRLTPDEQRTLMTLWSIARSPLIMGGDLRHLDAATLALLTNREVLAVNQGGIAAAPVYTQDGLRAWTSRAKGDGLNLAMFNTGDKPGRFGIDTRWLGTADTVRVRDLWAGRDLAPATKRVEASIPPHGAVLYRLT